MKNTVGGRELGDRFRKHFGLRVSDGAMAPSKKLAEKVLAEGKLALLM